MRYSIIIPVYNVAPYLRECLDSILAQNSPSEYEVILVDDGSTDRSGTICDEYAAKYPQFHAIHQGNLGVSEARNAGMDAAAGEFVLFMDSDDLWLPGMLSCMDEFVNAAPDIAMFSYLQFQESSEIVIDRPTVAFPTEQKHCESGVEYMERMFASGKSPSGYVWACMFRRAFLAGNNLRFRVGIRYMQDFDFLLDCYTAAKTLISVNRPLYGYRIRKGSTTHTRFIPAWMDALDVLRRWIDRYPNNVMANVYCAHGLHFSCYGTREETREMVARYAENADILKLVSTPKMKVACFLYRALGYYGGSKAYMWLVGVKHAALRRKK